MSDREEFLQLYPVDKVWGSDEMLNDPLVARRCGSTDILDAKKMRTLFMDYPDSGRRYKLRFNVSGCDPKSVRVSTDGDRIVVRATRYEEDGGADGREYCRKIQKPKDVDHTRFKAFDGREYCRKIQKPKDVDHTRFKAYLSCTAARYRSPRTSTTPGSRRTSHRTRCSSWRRPFHRPASTYERSVSYIGWTGTGPPFRRFAIQLRCLWPPDGIGQAIIFLPCVFYLLLLFLA